ncbi:MAG: hypothetical protein HY698_07320 [Deltaproteobacteria bacterium]|nr:hypothetical protein [Deltaproteobacteria bacterium]
MKANRCFVLGLGACAIAALPRVAEANERHMTYTYESAVMPKGAMELELWTTPRIGRDKSFARFDQRVELEYGVTDSLLTALYLNFNYVRADTGAGTESDLEFAGISSEWKYKLLDPVADAFGLAVYGEVTASHEEGELEAKVILDKKIGNVHLAVNLVAEVERYFEEGENELILEADLGAVYRFTPNFSAGIEVRNHNEFPGFKEYEHSALFAGPVVSYATEKWWAAFTFLPQLPALKTHEHGDSSLDLAEHEKYNARLLVAFHL